MNGQFICAVSTSLYSSLMFTSALTASNWLSFALRTCSCESDRRISSHSASSYTTISVFGARDNASANQFSCTGMCSTAKSYTCKNNTHRRCPVSLPLIHVSLLRLDRYLIAIKVRVVGAITMPVVFLHRSAVTAGVLWSPYLFPLDILLCGWAHDTLSRVLMSSRGPCHHRATSLSRHGRHRLHSSMIAALISSSTVLFSSSNTAARYSGRIVSATTSITSLSGRCRWKRLTKCTLRVMNMLRGTLGCCACNINLLWACRNENVPPKRHWNPRTNSCKDKRDLTKSSLCSAAVPTCILPIPPPIPSASVVVRYNPREIPVDLLWVLPLNPEVAAQWGSEVHPVIRSQHIAAANRDAESCRGVSHSHLVSWLDYLPPTDANREHKGYQYASYEAAPGFSHVGIGPDNATGRWVLWGISRFPHSFHSGTFPYSPHFTLMGSEDLNAKSHKSLRSTRFPQPCIPLVAAVDVVRQCCALVAPADSLLVAKGCQLLSNLMSRQQLQLPPEPLRVAVAWCARALSLAADIALLDLLRALELLLRRRVTGVSAAAGGGGWGAQVACERDVRLAALQCLEVLAEGLDECWLEDVAAIFLEQLEAEQAADQDELQLCKVLVCALKGLRAVLSRSQPLLHRLLGAALGCIKAYMLRGLPGHAGLRPQHMFPSLLAQPDTPLPPPGIRPTKPQLVHGMNLCSVAHFRFISQTIRLRKSRGSGPKKKTEAACEKVSPAPMSSFRRFTTEDGLSDGHSSPSAVWSRTSDSEFSDSEGRQLVRLREAQARVRQAALTLMLAISKGCDKKVLFGYWPGLLPDGTPGPHARTLATCLLKDSSPRCRLAVADILVSLLPGSRPFLLHAHSSDKETAFTSFSVEVGNMVQELHRVLCLAVLAENSLVVLVALLRCLAALVQNTPFHRLPPTLAPRVISVARNFIQHADAKVQVGSLTVLGSLAAVERGGGAEVVRPALQGEEPWLLELCLRLPAQPSCPVPIRVEALQLLAALAITHFPAVLLPSLTNILRLLHRTLTDTDPTVRLHAARALEAICSALHSTHRECGVDGQVLGQWWEELLTGPLVLMLQHPDHAALRAVGCDCLASLNEGTFLQLLDLLYMYVVITYLFQAERHTLIIALLLGCSRDEPSVRASAIRALSICVLFHPLREDVHFVLDTAEAVVGCLRDDQLAVRMKASWSLANLTDALVLNASEEETEDAPVSLLTQLIECSITAAKDNEKVRCNAVRALGNLLQIMRSDTLEMTTVRELMSQAVHSLVRNATSGTNMKVRWNACYAMGNLLRNQAMYEATWQEEVFSALTQLVVDSRNFKVRTSAALALGVPGSRTAYAHHYLATWMALLQGLAHSDCAQAFSEFQHRDQLLDQVSAHSCKLPHLLVIDQFLYCENLKKMLFKIMKVGIETSVQLTKICSKNCFRSSLLRSFPI
ncbi:hypothetical protein PR048_026918 [Dryococelus australis]|uniref:HEAT repeat-containing protein 6 n=1 Tax=Dryococelus australis TaxID=614101 RepID=A0ABQ9GMP3_9NEOP|nr:hypothetical protein PR048_026918 [Dryococelus australis]